MAPRRCSRPPPVTTSANTARPGGGCSRSWRARRPCRSCDRRKRRCVRARVAAARRRGVAPSPFSRPRDAIHKAFALAEAALARKRYDEARRLRTSSLVSLFPATHAVERLRRSVRAELRLDSQSRTSAQSPTGPARATTSESALLAPPNRRTLARQGRLRLLAGPAPSRPSLAMGWASRQTGPMLRSTRRSISIGNPGAGRTRCRHMGDWRPPAAGRYGSALFIDTPLRATFYIRRRRRRPRRYAWDSATIASAILRRLWFTDGNDRIEAERLSRGPRRGTAGPQRRAEGGVTNTRLDAPYFNPPRHVPADIDPRPRGTGARAKPSPGVPTHGRRDRAAGLCHPLDRFGLVRAHPSAQPTESSVYHGVAYARRVYDGTRRGPPLMINPTSLPMTPARILPPGAGSSCPSCCTTSWTSERSSTRTARPRAISWHSSSTSSRTAGTRSRSTRIRGPRRTDPPRVHPHHD